jgi:hypothetical protein
MVDAAKNKASLIPLDAEKQETGETIYVQYNPGNYSTIWNIAWSDPEGQRQTVQWTNTTAGDLVLTLNFDSYEERGDVTSLSGKIRAQLDPGQSSDQAVGCRFHWGKVVFDGRVKSIKEDFTLFLGDGTPVRSVVTLTLMPWPEVP